MRYEISNSNTIQALEFSLLNCATHGENVQKFVEELVWKDLGFICYLVNINKIDINYHTILELNFFLLVGNTIERIM